MSLTDFTPWMTEHLSSCNKDYTAYKTEIYVLFSEKNANPWVRPTLILAINIIVAVSNFSL